MLWLHISELGKGLWAFRSPHWFLLHVDVLDPHVVPMNRSRTHRVSLPLPSPAAGPVGSPPQESWGSFQYVYRLSFLFQGRWIDVLFLTLYFIALFFIKFCYTSFKRLCLLSQFFHFFLNLFLILKCSLLLALYFFLFRSHFQHDFLSSSLTMVPTSLSCANSELCHPLVSSVISLSLLVGVEASWVLFLVGVVNGCACQVLSVATSLPSLTLLYLRIRWYGSILPSVSVTHFHQRWVFLFSGWSQRVSCLVVSYPLQLHGL